MLSPEPLSLPEALTLCRDSLNMTYRLQGDDRHAVYPLLDALGGAVAADQPASLCKAGCSACCAQHKAFFRIFRSEWEPIEQALRARGEQLLGAFLRHFYEVYGPYLPALEQWQLRLDRDDAARPVREEFPVDCPLLEDHRCSVYADRPSICRAFGLFGLSTTAQDGKIYACLEQQDALAPETGHSSPTALLPSFTPFYKRVELLCHGEDKRLIPLWIARTFPRDGLSAWLAD